MSKYADTIKSVSEIVKELAAAKAMLEDAQTDLDFAKSENWPEKDVEPAALWLDKAQSEYNYLSAIVENIRNAVA